MFQRIDDKYLQKVREVALFLGVVTNCHNVVVLLFLRACGEIWLPSQISKEEKQTKNIR
jgi:hypothetical protein